jgi:hypothetical protein
VGRLANARAPGGEPLEPKRLCGGRPAGPHTRCRSRRRRHSRSRSTARARRRTDLSLDGPRPGMKHVRRRAHRGRHSRRPTRDALESIAQRRRSRRDRRVGVGAVPCERGGERVVTTRGREQRIESGAGQRRQTAVGSAERRGRAGLTLEPLDGAGNGQRRREAQRIAGQGCGASHDLSPRPRRST